MLRNYLIIAVRTILKQKGYTFINISGLAIGIACTVLTLLYVQDELTFDSFHKNANSVYRIIEDLGNQHIASTNGALAGILTDNLPEVANTVTVHKIYRCERPKSLYRPRPTASRYKFPASF